MSTSPKGLGDSVANLTRKIGIKPCNKCKKRQRILNKMFPYKKGSLSYRIRKK